MRRPVIAWWLPPWCSKTLEVKKEPAPARTTRKRALQKAEALALLLASYVFLLKPEMFHNLWPDEVKKEPAPEAVDQDPVTL